MNGDEILEALDDQQRQVATTFGHPVAVLAGAGTGKTRAITHRIAYGAATGALDPRRVLAVTFTKKAAGEMKHRLSRLGVTGAQARTFHAAALKQVQYFWPEAYGAEFPRVESRIYALLAEAARPTGVEVEQSVLRDLSTQISWAKVSNVPPTRFAEIARRQHRDTGSMEPDVVARIFANYEQIKRRRGVVDFGDILLCAVAMMHEHPQIAEAIRDQYRHLTVDEFQDVSPIQKALLDHWVGDNDDLCVVGDPCQSIHSFAGADPAYLTQFTRDYPDARVLRLSQNYRSTPQILRHSNRLISSKDRLRHTREEGAPITLSMDPYEGEVTAVLGWLRSLREQGLAWEDMAILYRVNAQAEPFVEACQAASIPIVVRDGESEAPEGGVTLSTMHAAKGSEWQAVAIISASEGYIPFSMAETSEQLAEERRLFYVGLTRAKSYLRISWEATRNGRREPSRYVKAIAPDLQDISAVVPKRTRRSLPTCYVCGSSLSGAPEIKVGRHVTCAATFDEALFERLKAWRLQRAHAASMPAFVVFTDATLRAMCEQKPTTTEELLAINGVGRKKVSDYGDEVLAIIRES